MSASDMIDQQIASHADWRGAMMERLRKLIHEADPDIVEEWKWETAVYAHGGIVCAVAGFKDHVKVNFFQGAALADPNKLFNAGLDAKKSRGIDFCEGDKLPVEALKSLIRSAVQRNASPKP